MPWDIWGLVKGKDKDISAESMDLLDNAAALSEGEVDFLEVRRLYENDQNFKVPDVITSYTAAGALEIEVATEEVIK